MILSNNNKYFFIFFCYYVIPYLFNHVFIPYCCMEFIKRASPLGPKLLLFEIFKEKLIFKYKIVERLYY